MRSKITPRCRILRRNRERAQFQLAAAQQLADGLRPFACWYVLHHGLDYAPERAGGVTPTHGGAVTRGLGGREAAGIPWGPK